MDAKREKRIEAWKNKALPIIDALKKRQWFSLLNKISKRIPNALLITGKNYILVFNKNKERSYRRLKTYGLKKVNKQSLGNLTECQGQSYKTLYYDRLFEEKRECYAAYVDNRVAGFSWLFKNHYVITFDGYQRTNVEIFLSPDKCVLGDGFVNPHFRLSGIFPMMMSDIISEKAKNRKVIAFVRIGNQASLKAHLRFGFEVQGEVSLIRLLNLNLLTMRCACDKVTFKIFRGRRTLVHYDLGV